MVKPFLSIIIPTRNEEKLLPHLLACLRQQTAQNFEVIVADNKSTDRTCSIARKAGCIVTAGGLPSIGRNIGARAARADLLLFLDADVIFANNFIEKSLETIKQGSYMVATVRAVPQSTHIVDRSWFMFWNWYLRVTASFFPHAAGFCIFCTKRIHEAIHGFDENMTLAEDSDYVRRASKYGTFGMLSTQVNVSVRRLERDGRLRYGWRLVKCEAYRLFVGEPRKGTFNYDFDGYDKNSATKSTKNKP